MPLLREINFRYVAHRLAEGSLLIAGTAALILLALEGQGKLPLQATLPGNLWVEGAAVVLGVLAFIAGFIAIIEAMQWLLSLLVRDRRAGSEKELRDIAPEFQSEIVRNEDNTKA